MQGYQHFKTASQFAFEQTLRAAKISWTRTRAGHRCATIFFFFPTEHLNAENCTEEIFQRWGFFPHQSRKLWISCGTLSFCSPPSLCYAQRSFSISLLCYAAAFQNVLCLGKHWKKPTTGKNGKWRTAKPEMQLTVTFSEEAWKTRKNALKDVNISFRSISW